MQIRKTAVLGSGVMGAQIAAHLANAGFPCLLLDIAPTALTAEEAAKGLTLESRAVRNRIVQAGYDAAVKAMKQRQKTRSTRTVRDQIDRALLDLVGLYRDVLLLQVDSGLPLINEEMRPQLAQLAAQGVANDTGRRLRAITYARAQVQANVTPLIALESLMVELKDPWIRSATA